MDKYMNKSELAARIVYEVKSHGLFDEFRRECMADVDTKPAYQNLRHRVETTVQAFLQEQKRTPDTNKLQLREKLRSHINEKGFLETGVERIVDQVVNPKINSTFLPKIEDLAYKIMGIEKPKERRMKAIKVDTNQLGFLPIDLEQVSPDSSSKSPVEEMNFDTDGQGVVHKTDNIIMDDFESPAFEPLESSKGDSAEVDDTCIDMDIAISNDTDYGTNTVTGDATNRDSLHHDDAKSNLSSISGLTSNGSTNGGEEPVVSRNESIALEKEHDKNEERGQLAEIETEIISADVPMDEVTSQEVDVDTTNAAVLTDTCSREESNEDYRDNFDLNQDSALSRISNNSRLSITTNTNTALAEDEIAHNSDSIEVNNVGDGDKVENSIRDMTLCDIDEEAQMQKFNESSSSNNSSNAGNSSSEVNYFEVPKPLTSFDIKKDEIRFEGPERKAFGDFSISPYEEKDAEKPTEDCLTPTSSKFEPSSFNVKPIEVSCADLNVDDVRTSISDCFETNSSQSNSNNLVIIENQDDDNNAKSMEAPLSSSVSPITNESTATPPMEEKRASREKSTEGKSESSSSRGKSHSENRSHSASRRSSSSHTDRDKYKDRTSSTASSKERSSSSSHSRDKYRKSSSSYSTSRSRDGKDKDRGKPSSRESSSRRNESSTFAKENPSLERRKSSNDREGSTSNHKSSRRDRDQSSRASDPERKDKPSLSSSRGKGGSSNSGSHRTHHSDKRSSDERRDDRHRSDSRKSSSRKEDDHSSHKSKVIPRQRSRSKDSNDGSSQPGNGSSNALNGTNNQNSDGKESKTDHIQSNNSTTCVPVESLSTENEPCITASDSIEMDFEEPSPAPDSPVGFTMDAECERDDEFVLPTKPVVVDQILSGNEINLESFIDSQQQNRNDPIISQIEQTMQSQSRTKMPRVAENFSEAQKFVKLQKQREREDQKKTEKAMVLAKKYMRTNSSMAAEDSQGVELEFACGGEARGARPRGPTISSPVKLIDTKNEMVDAIAGKEPIDEVIMIEMEKDPVVQLDSDVSSTDKPSEETISNDRLASNSPELIGFNDREITDVQLKLSTLNRFIETQLFFENNQLSLNARVKSKAQKRRNNSLTATRTIAKKTCSNTWAPTQSDPVNNHIKMNFGVRNPELFLAKVIISKSDTPTHVKLKSSSVDELANADIIDLSFCLNSGVAKASKKTRYSNDELFKPRPSIGGSRSRRRGVTCDDDLYNN